MKPYVASHHLKVVVEVVVVVVVVLLLLLSAVFNRSTFSKSLEQVFYMPDVLPVAQPTAREGTQVIIKYHKKTIRYH